MKSEHEQQLRSAAIEFRCALEERGLELLPDLYWQFPTGWCSDAAPLLAQHLIDSGLGRFDYVCGEQIEVDPAEVWQIHAWLEQDGVIIDITADQFPEIDEPVMITRDKTWHSQFTECSREEAGIHLYDSGVSNRLREAHHGLIQFLSTEQSPEVIDAIALSAARLSGRRA